MKYVFVMLLSCGATGCGPWTAAQMALVTQARRGVASVEKSSDQRAAVARELEDLRRKRLDEAFDQDVRDRQELDADWVIEHRRAYAAALAAYEQERGAHRVNELAEKRDLEAIDAALVRLQMLQSIQAKFSLEEVWDAKH